MNLLKKRRNIDFPSPTSPSQILFIALYHVALRVSLTLKESIYFPQSQMDDKDRTIRIQQNMLQQYEKDKTKNVESNLMSPEAKNIETSTCATQTERVSIIDWELRTRRKLTISFIMF